MRDQLTSAGDATRPTEARVIDQASGLLRQQFVKIERCCRVVGRDVFANRAPILLRGSGPSELHELAPAIFWRTVARQAAASASTSSADTNSPAFAASMPT